MAASDVSFQDVNWDRQEEDDAQAIKNLINATNNPNESSGLTLNLDRPLEVGEKDDDAVDYEDFSDDDLPDEEPAHGHGDLPGLTDDAGTSNDTDDLFGEGRDSSPFGELDDHDPFALSHERRLSGGPPIKDEPEENLLELNFPEHYSTANQDPNIPAPAESTEELLKQSWPGYERGIKLDYNRFLPPKNAHYIPKVPVKVPKPLHPSKVSLDLAQDQEKSFRSAGSAYTDKRKRVVEAEAKGLIPIIEESDNDESDEEDFDWTPASQLEPIGGFSFADLEIICEDWESKVNPPPLQNFVPDDLEDEPMDEWEKEILGHSSKRRKITHQETDFMNIPRFAVPSFDDFESATKRIAKRVVLDLNDPYLLVDIREYDPSAKRRRIGTDGSFKRTGKGGLSSGLSKRFNFSNDEAYDALKENHQSKVRATIGNLSVEHSMPALKLSWPYYRVKLYTKDARAFHRPQLKTARIVNQIITFAKAGLRKRKELKGMSIQEIFKKTKDLSLGDHYSSASLLEYSEEHPTVLSNFGMGNRIINYYRRKTADDPERPQPDDKVGDVTVLLPEDKSPFSNFGMVDPGETVRTIHNAMYRAPIFKHEPKNTDFLVIRSSTGVGGIDWHIRNIDHLFAVGQQFPSLEIPGPHSRKVTNAAKNRMKMIAYRKIRHSPQQHLKIGEITAHIADSSDMQNRQKLKEFIHYDKTEKVWKMKPGENPPEESVIRAMVTPEEVCLIDAMQVGARHLEDSGYAAEGEDDENNEDVEGKNLEQELAPWRTSKAFIEASTDKAMLQLHGDGDPSGHGLAFSFIKTSMKGGYIGALQGPSATSAAAIEAERKANGGHTYNVRKQQGLYNEAIRDIWEKQKANLSDPVEHPENEMELEQESEDEKQHLDHRSFPAGNFDDSASQFSTGSRRGKAMRITRQVKNKFGGFDEIIEIVKDPRVWREYQKRRAAIEADATKLDFQATSHIHIH